MKWIIPIIPLVGGLAWVGTSSWVIAEVALDGGKPMFLLPAIPMFFGGCLFIAAAGKLRAALKEEK